jgi:hypothetical protein
LESAWRKGKRLLPLRQCRPRRSLKSTKQLWGQTDWWFGAQRSRKQLRKREGKPAKTSSYVERIYPQIATLPESSRETPTATPSDAHRTRMLVLAHYRTINLTQGHPRGIRSMKRQTEKPAEQVMRFFTPELYCQFNSADDEVADRANEAWERAVQEYQRHLQGIRHRMPSQVKKLADLCLHDAEMLGLEPEVQSPESPTQEPCWPSPVCSPVTIISLKQDETIHSLIYIIWDRVREHPPVKSWPFSKLRRHWLYDEIDVASDHLGMFLHRILFSDGSILEIPFISVIISSVSLTASGRGSAPVSKRIA